MSLKSRIDEALDGATWLVRTSHAQPNLSGIPDTPVAVTRYSGSRIIAGRRRPSVEVMLILGSSEDQNIVDGDAETTEERLVGLFRTVDDCYPELIPTIVN